MGLNTALISLIKAFFAPEAWCKNRQSRVGECVIIDLLLYIRSHTLVSYKKEETDGKVTGHDVCQGVIKMCVHNFYHKSSVVVLIIDDPVNVPKQKEETQKKRSESRKKKYENYSSQSKFDHGGIRQPDPEKPGYFLEAEKFDIESVLRNRVLRKTLAAYISKTLDEMIDLEPGQYIIFYYEDLKPADIYGVKGESHQEFKDSINSKITQASHGEFDTSSAFWGSMFMDKYPIRIKTKDTDMIPIWSALVDSLSMIKSSVVHYDIIWEYDDNNLTCNMNTLWKKIKEKSKMDIYSFMTLCALCGNDYLQKNLVTHNIGIPVIAEAVKRSRDVIKSDPFFKDKNTLVHIIQWCHTQLIDEAKFSSPADMQEVAESNGSKRKRKRKSSSSSQHEQQDDEEGEDHEETQIKKKRRLENEEGEVDVADARSVNDVLKRERVLSGLVYKPSTALSPYSCAYINSYWSDKGSKRITGMPDNANLLRCLDRLKFSCWFWKVKPFTREKYEETLSIASFSTTSSSSSFTTSKNKDKKRKKSPSRTTSSANKRIKFSITSASK